MNGWRVETKVRKLDNGLELSARSFDGINWFTSAALKVADEFQCACPDGDYTSGADAMRAIDEWAESIGDPAWALGLCHAFAIEPGRVRRRSRDSYWAAILDEPRPSKGGAL